MPCLTLLWAAPTAHPAPQGTVGLWAVPPRTDVQVGVQGKWRIHQPVLLLMARLPVHNVAFGFLVSQGDGGNLEGESSMRPDPEMLYGRKQWQHSQGPDAGGWQWWRRQEWWWCYGTGPSREQTTGCAVCREDDPPVSDRHPVLPSLDDLVIKHFPFPPLRSGCLLGPPPGGQRTQISHKFPSDTWKNHSGGDKKSKLAAGSGVSAPL